MPAFKAHSTVTVDQPWDAGANEKRARSGEKRDYYGRIYGWYDPQGKEGAKGTYKFPHHEVAADGTPGAANTNGCSAAIGVLNGGRGGSDIPAADRAGVHAHLARHLKDGKKEVPPLKGEAEEAYPLAFGAMQDKVWGLHRAKLQEITALVERLLAGEKLEWPEAAQGKGAGGEAPPYQMQGGVAVIPVMGVLDKRLNLFSKFSGGSSYEMVGAAVRAALADPNVKALLLDIDSPGGSVDGVKTVADQIFAARERKPIVAFGNGMMASAAYWLGSAASRVVADDTAIVGSIGVALTHFDRSAQDVQRGVKRTEIYAGQYKRIASDSKPLSPEGQDYLQGMVDTYYNLFLEAVARNRGQDSGQVHQEMADGRDFIGKQALQAGLVDQIGTFDDALALAQKMAPGGPGGKINMDRKTLESQHPELFAEIKALGAAEGQEAAKQAGFKLGVETERTRTVKILGKAGLRGLTLETVQDGSSYEAALEKFIDHQDQVRAEALATLAAAAPPVVGTQPQIETRKDPPVDAPIETVARAEWDKDAELRKGFVGGFEAYLAFRRAESKGLVTK